MFRLLPQLSFILAAVTSSTALRADAASSSQPGPAEARRETPAHTDTVFTPSRYASLQEWQSRRDWLRDQVRLAAGLVPETPRTPIRATIFGKLVRDGYTVEKVYFASSPGMYVTGNLYRPANSTGKCPAVACPHGHWANGRLHHEDLGSIPARCITLARNGAVVFAYDMVGYNDSARTFQHREPRLDTPETALWGIGHLQLQTFNSIRVIDFLQSLPDVDPKRIGVTGASGGGTQTFILGAVDDRVAVDCPVNMISSTMQGGCICENAPLLRIDTNNMEIAALFAPRPRLMVSATGDWTKLTPTVEFPFMRSIYALYGATDKVANVHIDAPHNYNLQSRQAMYAFFGKWLLENPHPESITEGAIPVENPEDLLVFTDTTLPADLAGPEQIIQRSKQQIKERMAQYRPTNRAKLEQLTGLIKLWLEHAVGSSWPRADELSTHSGLIETRTGILYIHDKFCRHGRTVPSSTLSYLGPKKPQSDNLVIWVDPDGLSAQRKTGMDPMLAAGCQVMFIEPFGTGANASPSTPPGVDRKLFTTFNRTDTAEAVYDVVTAVVSASVPDEIGLIKPSRITLVGSGQMGPVCLLARALVPEEFAKKYKLRVIADLNGFDGGSDSAYVDRLFVPQIQRFGGLPAIAAVASTTPLWIHNTDGKFDSNWATDAAKVAGSELKVDEEPASAEDFYAWITKVD